MNKSKKLILFGTGDLARIAYEYFTNDSEYEIVAFTVDPIYCNDVKEFCGLPVVPFDLLLHQQFSPETHDIHICIVYGNMNRLRQMKCKEAKARGYKLASYISSHAFVSPSARIGEHVFIFEDNTIQPNVTIGNNCILWSGNHVGHDSVVGDNVFISSHVVISGWCDVGANCFIGVNSTLANNTTIGKETWVMHGAILNGEVPPNSFVKTMRSDIVPLNKPALERALKSASEKAKA